MHRLTRIALDLGLAVDLRIISAMDELAHDPENMLYDEFGACVCCGYYHDDVCECWKEMARELHAAVMNEQN